MKKALLLMLLFSSVLAVNIGHSIESKNGDVQSANSKTAHLVKPVQTAVTDPV